MGRSSPLDDTLVEYRVAWVRVKMPLVDEWFVQHYEEREFSLTLPPLCPSPATIKARRQAGVGEFSIAQ